MRQLRLYACMACLAVLLGCQDRNGASAGGADPEYERQLKQSARQLDATTEQIEKYEEQLERFDKLLQRWEDQADRFDKILQRWEQQPTPPAASRKDR